MCRLTKSAPRTASRESVVVPAKCGGLAGGARSRPPACRSRPRRCEPRPARSHRSRSASGSCLRARRPRAGSSGPPANRVATVSMPRRRAHHRHGEFGDRLLEHVRRVGAEHAGSRRTGPVDVVVADAESRDQTARPERRVEALAIRAEPTITARTPCWTTSSQRASSALGATRQSKPAVEVKVDSARRNSVSVTRTTIGIGRGRYHGGV